MNDLTPSEIRVLGCLMEKQRTTPDTYPLTLNALRLACNQATNRDPVVDYDDAVLRDALHRLGRRGWARLTSGAGSRVAKYRHLLAETLPMDDGEQAVMCVLMLRGAQTPGELKQRSERMHPFADLDDVDETLQNLIERELVVAHERRPGQKELRYEQILGIDYENGEASPAHAPAASPGTEASRSSSPSPSSATRVGLAERIEALERELREQGDLRERVAALEREVALLSGGDPNAGDRGADSDGQATHGDAHDVDASEAHESDAGVARDRAFMPAGTERFLERRTLQADHRRLAQVLAPGMAVLDVGCGSGAITSGIATAVGASGRVVGVDLNEQLIAVARRTHPAENLEFRVGDVAAVAMRDEFDVVTCSRLLLWLPDPEAALAAMAAAARPGGLVLVLDYDLRNVVWEPEPPASTRSFHSALLRWRAEAGMDNSIGLRLPQMFEAAGLQEVRSTPQHEDALRSQPDFDARLALWPDVIATRGHQLVADGFLREDERQTAERELREWAAGDGRRQLMELYAVEGRRPLD